MTETRPDALNDTTLLDGDLATVVVDFLERLRALGYQPNRTVVFAGAPAPPPGSGTCQGWLLDDAFSGRRPSRWVLLDDGHVWHETLYETREESYPECTWVDWRSERLTEVLSLTLEDVQRGGRGGLAPGDGRDQFYVRDRRRHDGRPVESDRRRRAR